MTATVVLHRASRSRWLARRRRGLTATDAAAVLGLSQWKTPLGVWLDKVDPQPEDHAYRYDRGHALEGPLAAEYARQTGAVMERPPLILAHPEQPTLIASLDWFAHTPDATELVECKTAYDWTEWADNDLPDQYAAQVLFQLAITGLDTGVVFADVAGRLETRRIPRDLDWEADQIPVLLRWWDEHVVARVPPPLDPFRDYALLNRVWRVEPGEEIEADDQTAGALRAWQALNPKQQERYRTLQGLKTLVRAGMREAQHLTIEGTRVASLTSNGALRIKPAGGADANAA